MSENASNRQVRSQEQPQGGRLDKLQFFEGREIRSVWVEDEEEWYFSIVDVVAVLTESKNPQTYWRVLKKGLLDEGNQTVTHCNGLKMRAADGKMRLTDAGTTEQILRLVQSIPSPKAEPFKRHPDERHLSQGGPLRKPCPRFPYHARKILSTQGQ